MPGDAILVRATDQQFSRHIARIDEMHCGEEVFAGERVMNTGRAGAISHVGWCGVHMRDDVSGLWVTGFSDMDFVAVPGVRLFVAKPHLRVIRRVACRR